MASVTPGTKQEQEHGEKKATGTLFGFFKKTSEPSKLPLAPLCSNTVSLKNPTPKGSSSSAPKPKATTKKTTKATAARGVTPDVKSLHENNGSVGIASHSSSQSAREDDVAEDAMIMATSSLSGSHPVTITKSECDNEDSSNTDDRSPFQRMGSDSSTPFIRGIAQDDSDDMEVGPVSGLGHGSPVMPDKFATTNDVKVNQSKEEDVVQMEVMKEKPVASDSADMEEQQEPKAVHNVEIEVVDITDDQPVNEDTTSASASSSSAAKKTTATTTSAKEKKPRAKRTKAQPNASAGAPKKAARGSKATKSSSSATPATTAENTEEGEGTGTATTETTDEAMVVDGEVIAENSSTAEGPVVIAAGTGTGAVEVNKSKGKRKASIGASLAASAVARAEAAEDVELPLEIAKKVQCNKDRMDAAVIELVQLET